MSRLIDAGSGWNREDEEFVVVMPSRLGGKPTIGHRRISTQQVADLYWHFGGFDELKSYELTEKQVVIAVWFEARYGTRMRRARWKEWLDDNDARLWSAKTYGVPANPPTAYGLLARDPVVDDDGENHSGADEEAESQIEHREKR
jgi:uncharacterized protein (DUF433 family)